MYFICFNAESILIKNSNRISIKSCCCLYISMQRESYPKGNLTEQVKLTYVTFLTSA